MEWKMGKKEKMLVPNSFLFTPFLLSMHIKPNPIIAASAVICIFFFLKSSVEI